MIGGDLGVVAAPMTLDMSSGELLRIEPRILKLPFELRKPASCSIKLHNMSNEYIGFKFQQDQRTRPKKYAIRPPKGVVLPRSSFHVIITMQGHLEELPDMECEDELVIQSVIMHQAAAKVAKDVSLEMLRCSAFMEPRNIVDLATLRVVLVPPPPTPSPVHEVSDRVPVEPRKHISCSIQLYNKTNEHIAFKFQQDLRKGPKKYIVRPPKGVVLPRSTCNVTITMQGHQEGPPNIWCEDELLIQSVIMRQASAKVTKDVSLEMLRCMAFTESGNNVDIVTLKVVYVPPPKPLAQVCEGSKGDSWTMSCSSYSDNAGIGVLGTASRLNEPQQKTSRKAGDCKENPLKVESDEDEECYEIDPIIFTRKLTFNEMDDVALVGENGPVALRDFPHPRHLCGCFPFKSTSHESFCNKCFCCVCEVVAPCLQWRGVDGHCHLSKKIR